VLRFNKTTSDDVSEFMGFLMWGLWIASIVFGIMGIRQKQAPKGTAIGGVVIASIMMLIIVYYIGNNSGFSDGYDWGYGDGYGSGYETGYEVPWYEKMFE